MWLIYHTVPDAPAHTVPNKNNTTGTTVFPFCYSLPFCFCFWGRGGQARCRLKAISKQWIEENETKVKQQSKVFPYT